MIKLKLVSLPVKPRYYGGKFKAAPKWLVVHYTGTPGSSALSEARYLTKTLTKKSTHFIVDDATVYRSTPESRIAWHCGGGQCANPEQKTLEELSEMHASDWRYDLAAKNHLREEGMATQLHYSCLENPHGQRILVGFSPWGHKELDMTEQLSTHSTRVLGAPT